MSRCHRASSGLVVAAVIGILGGTRSPSSPQGRRSDPYHPVKNWAQASGHVEWGQVTRSGRGTANIWGFPPGRISMPGVSDSSGKNLVKARLGFVQAHGMAYEIAAATFGLPTQRRTTARASRASGGAGEGQHH